VVKTFNTAMAWRSGGKTNLQLISNMKSNGLIRSERIFTVSKKRNGSLTVVHRSISIIQAMNAVDRANYVKDGVDAYYDSPLLRFFFVTFWL
jgi:protein-L-isoaspartate(D-aspartate) O-methyltransferase